MKIIDLRHAYDYQSLALHFGIPPGVLKSHLYGGSAYSVFLIPKKTGGTRTIQSPGRLRRSIQKKLLPVFDEAYRVSDFAHGFVAGRNVKSNAQPHVRGKTLINVDLQDFFSSITFMRVRGLLLKPPFGLHWNVANIVAQACCFNGVLPTGGITSPAISNLILAKLDKRISSLVVRLGGDYSRYADDLTMSFDRPIAQLSSLIKIDSVGNLSPGAALSEIVTSEGFSINQGKLRIAEKGARKIVTGLVVNEKVNVRRSWYLALESKIYAVETFGWDVVARQEYPEESDISVAVRMLMRRLHGKLAYLYMVRGHGDWLCADLAYRFNKLHSDIRLRVSSVELIAREERAPRGVCIVLGYPAPAGAYAVSDNQGTGFCVSSGLIITAAHVVLDDDEALLPWLYVMNERTKLLEQCEVVALCSHADIAILKVCSGSVEAERHRFKLHYAVDLGDMVTSVGYPNYASGNFAATQRHQVVKKFVSSLVAKAQINGAIQGGLSGGPVLNSDMKVVGLVHRGVLAASGIPEMIEAVEIKKLADANGLTL